MSKSEIGWTDEVWNPVTGCTRVSAGCARCYASALHNRRYRANVQAALNYDLDEAARWFRKEGSTIPQDFRAKGAWAANLLPYPPTYDTPFAQVQLHPERLEVPLHWRKPRRVFVNSMSDLFHEDVLDEFLDRVFAVMALTPQHTYQVLTKRPERMREYLAGEEPYTRTKIGISNAYRTITGLTEVPRLDWPLPNVWCGTSAEDQTTLEARWRELEQAPAAVRFLSLEPLLELPQIASAFAYDARGRHDYTEDDQQRPIRPGQFAGLDWVIVGGESGANRRDCGVDAIVSVARQCQAAGVPVFVKQDSAFRPGQQGRLPDDVWALKEFPGAHHA